MFKSTKIAEFRISKDRLINALTHISNITHKASIALIVDRNKGKAEMGISFNNVAYFDENGHQFDLYSSYPIFHSEMVCKHYFTRNADEWPIIYIACTPEFIVSVSTLPPTMSDGKEVLGMALWNIEDDNKIKSEAVIFGDHHSHIASIIEHSDIMIKDPLDSLKINKIIKADTSGTDIPIGPRNHYG